MKEICIPITEMKEAERAELEVRLSDTKLTQYYRLESVSLKDLSEDGNTSTQRVDKLQHYISSYSKDWELIQIFDFSEGVGFIHLLYRKRSK